MLDRGARIVITGGAGFIGSHLVERLLADGFAEVVVLDNFSRGRRANLAQVGANPRLQVVEGDVRDGAVLAATLRPRDVVFHLAARSIEMGEPPDEHELFTTNTLGTFNVLSAAAAVGARSLVFTSARDVYGEPIALPVDEDHPLIAINTYGASKVAGEAYCRAFRRSYGLQVIILRLGNVYGPRDVGHAIPVWIEQAHAGRELLVQGGKEIIDFLWIEQAVEALVRAGAAPGSLPPINVASGTGTRILELARRIARLADGKSKITVLPPDERSVTRFVASTTRMREMLRLEPPLDPLIYLPTLLPAPVVAPPAVAPPAVPAAGADSLSVVLP